MDYVSVRSIMDRKEGFLRRNLLITPSLLYGLQENGIITETTRQIMMVSIQSVLPWQLNK